MKLVKTCVESQVVSVDGAKGRIVRILKCLKRGLQKLGRSLVKYLKTMSSELMNV